ncbi:MAG: hypothetical protein J6A21_04145 [Lentisphaeria bacterium]|nr:hypothetical protein [Lentisphaeria bacterium]
MKRLSPLFVLILFFCTVLSASEKVLLAEKGKKNCCIVIPENASSAHKRAAGELARYLGKISSSPVPEVVTAPVKGLLPVRLELDGENLPHIDAYRIKVTPEGVRISGKTVQA